MVDCLVIKRKLRLKIVRWQSPRMFGMCRQRCKRKHVQDEQ